MSSPSGQKLLNGPTVLLNERVPVFNYLHPLLHEQSATRKPTHRRAAQDEAHCRANFPIFIDSSSASSILRISSPASGSSTCAVGRKSSGSSHDQHLLPIYHPGPTMTSVVSILRPLRSTSYFSCSSPPLSPSTHYYRRVHVPRSLSSAAPYNLHTTFNLASSLAPLIQHPHLSQCWTDIAFKYRRKRLGL